MQRGWPSPMAVEADVAENKSGKTLNRVQNGLNLQLNSWSPVRGLALFCNSQITRTSGDQLFLLPPWTSSRRLWAGAASGGDGLPNSSSRRRRSPRVTDSPAPAHRRARDVRTAITKPVKKSLAKTRKSPKNHPQIVLQTPIKVDNDLSESESRLPTKISEPQPAKLTPAHITNITQATINIFFCFVFINSIHQARPSRLDTAKLASLLFCFRILQRPGACSGDIYVWHIQGISSERISKSTDQANIQVPNKPRGRQHMGRLLQLYRRGYPR